jgi:hypothetical protein
MAFATALFVDSLESGRRVMTHQPAAVVRGRVAFDETPGRCTTVSGASFWWRVAARVLPGAAAAAALAAAVAITLGASAPTAGIIGAAVAAAWSVASLGIAAAALESDLGAKTPVAVRYRCHARRGADGVQVRRIAIDCPPADLSTTVAAALCELSPRTLVRRLGPGHIEALRPARGPLSPGTRIDVHLARHTDGSAAITVRSSPRGAHVTRLLFPASAFPDQGRSIENVEEFQLSLRRLVEGRGLPIPRPRVPQRRAVI